MLSIIAGLGGSLVTALLLRRERRQV